MKNRENILNNYERIRDLGLGAMKKKISPSISMYGILGYLFWSKIKVFLLFQNVQKQIDSLTKICFDVDNDAAQPGNRKSTLYRKLGFQVQQNLVLTSFIYLSPKSPPPQNCSDTFSHFIDLLQNL